MAYRPRRVRRTRATSYRRRSTTTRRRRTTRSSRTKTIVIQLVGATSGAAMSTGTLGKKAAVPLLRARF